MLTHFKMEELETLKCNISLMSQQNVASIPEKCYLRMKWRKSINHKTLEDNRKSLTSFGKNPTLDKYFIQWCLRQSEYFLSQQILLNCWMI